MYYVHYIRQRLYCRQVHIHVSVTQNSLLVTIDDVLENTSSIVTNKLFYQAPTQQSTLQLFRLHQLCTYVQSVNVLTMLYKLIEMYRTRANGTTRECLLYFTKELSYCSAPFLQQHNPSFQKLSFSLQSYWVCWPQTCLLAIKKKNIKN